MTSPHSKPASKVSLSGLTNFTFAQRPRESGVRRHKTTPFVRERFVQANFRFAVDPAAADYAFYLADPDRLVDWYHVELVVMAAKEDVVCPICLYPPCAAKITKCGHTFCWPCLLQYLSQVEKDMRRCPLCHEFVRANEVKSVVIDRITSLRDGQRAVFQLMQRWKSSTTVQPRAAWKDFAAGQLPLYTDQCSRLCKLSAATTSVVNQLFTRERHELQDALANCEALDPLSEPFILEALERLAKREQEWQQSQTSTPSAATAVSIPTSAAAVSGTGKRESPREDMSDPKRLLSVGDLHVFYQAADGQLVFLHPVNVKMLLREFGAVERCPDTITAPVVEIIHLSMTDGNRKRWRHLDHLPLSCDFEQCEIDLSAVVSSGTLHAFADELGKLKRNRQRQQREARATTAKSEAAGKREVKELGRYMEKLAAQTPAEPRAPPEDFVASAAAQAAAAAEAERLRAAAPPQPFWEKPLSFLDVVRGGPVPVQELQQEGTRSFLQALREEPGVGPQPVPKKSHSQQQQQQPAQPQPKQQRHRGKNQLVFTFGGDRRG